MGHKARVAGASRALAKSFVDQVVPSFRARARGTRRPRGNRLTLLEDNIHGALPEPLRGFLEIDDELELNHSHSSGLGPWDLLESTDRMAPAAAAGNLFEQIVIEDQKQFACNVGLLQIAASAIPIGIMKASDLYFVSLAEKADTYPVCWFVPQDDGEVVGVIADSLETFGCMSLLEKRAEDGDNPAAIRADAELIRGRCTPRWFGGGLSEILGEEWPDATVTSRMQGLYGRSLPWLYALSPYLRSVGQSDEACRDTLAERWKMVQHRPDGWETIYARARPQDRPHDAFYWLWRSYFLDEAALADVERICIASPRPIIADMAHLVAELRGGRDMLGIVNIPQVRGWLRDIAAD